MKVQCPSCDFQGQADRSKIPPQGVKVKCPKCGNPILVQSPPEQTAPPLQIPENPTDQSKSDIEAPDSPNELSGNELPAQGAPGEETLASRPPSANQSSGLSFKGPLPQHQPVSQEQDPDGGNHLQDTGRPDLGVQPTASRPDNPPTRLGSRNPGGSAVSSRFQSENAGLWARLAARLLDGAVFMLFFFLVVKPIYFKMAFSAFNEFASSPEMMEFLNSQQQPTLPDMSAMAGSITSALAMAQLLCWGFLLVYYIFFTGHYGATPGKMILGLRVKDSNDEDIGYLKAFGRFLADFVLMPFTLGIGYLIALFNEDKKGLHDIIAGTHVVRA